MEAVAGGFQLTKRWHLLGPAPEWEGPAMMEK